ncbi:hypothetical protein [Nocardiopsis sp. NPDC006938]|uniref:hypothetical protein n=1 Tax=Nocardiopsis sp. NPDC006938 TaxID=3364337 RepID=UPI0036A698D0
MIASRTLKTTTPTGELTAFVLAFPTPHGDGRCLVNVFDGPPGGVVVLSEIKSNPTTRVMDAWVPAIAATLGDDLGIVEPERLTGSEWYTHHGAFSYHYMELGPPTFTAIRLGWDGTAYTDPLEERRLLSAKDAESLAGRLGMSPVPEQLERLGEEV